MRVFRAAPPGSSRAAHPLADARLALGVCGGADRQPRLRLGGRRWRLRQLLSDLRRALRAARAAGACSCRDTTSRRPSLSQALGLEVAPEDHARVLLLVELRRQISSFSWSGPQSGPSSIENAGHRWHGPSDPGSSPPRRWPGQLRARSPVGTRCAGGLPAASDGGGQSNSRGAMLRFRTTVDTRRVYDGTFVEKRDWPEVTWVGRAPPTSIASRRSAALTAAASRR